MLRPHPRSRMGNPCSVAQLIAAHYCFGGGFFFGGAAGLGGGATGASCANTGFGANFGSDTPCTRAGSSPTPYRAHSAEQNSRLRALVRKVSQGHEFRSEKRFLLLPPSRRPGYKGGWGVSSSSLKQTEKISGRNFPAQALFSRCSPVSVVGRYAVLWQGVCRAFQNSSRDSCRGAWDVHCPLIGGYPCELRFTRLVSELYMPTAGTGSANGIDASPAGFRRARQCSPVGKRQYGHRIGIAKRTVGRYRTSQCSEELWYSVSGQARQAKLGDIPFSEGGFLGEHSERERQALCAPPGGQGGEGVPRQLWIRAKNIAQKFLGTLQAQ